MEHPPSPLNEEDRLAALRELDLLDTPAESDFDNLALIAAALCDTPMALLAVVDRHRLWFKARVGVEVAEMPREPSFCAHTMAARGLFIVNDTWSDARFAGHRLMSEEIYARFYAGVPLTTSNGLIWGTLCVLDHNVRDLSPSQREALLALGRQAVAQAELRRQRRQLEATVARLERSERHAREMREQLKDLLDHANDLVLSTDEHGRFIYVNLAGQRALGRRPEELAQMTLFEAIAPEEHGRYREVLERVRREGALSGVETVFLTRDGRRRIVDGNISWRQLPGVGSTSAGAGLNAGTHRAIFRDITSRRRAEETTRLYAEIVQEMQIALYVYRLEDPDDDRSLRLVAVNPAGAQLVGAPVEALLERPLDEVFPWVRGHGLPALWAEVVRTGQDMDLEELRGPASGHDCAFAIKAFPLPDRKVGVTFEDITLRKQSLAALRDNEARLRTVLESALDGIVACDEQGAIIEFNPEAERTFGYRRSQILGRPVFELFASLVEQMQMREILDLHLASGVSPARGRPREIQMRRADGSPFLAEMSIAATAIDGRPVFTICLRDITERKQVERMKNEFVSMVSHELRTPLTSIRGSLGLIEGGVVGPLPEPVLEMVCIARNNTDRLVRLINDILDLEKIESGKIELKPERVRLRELIETSLRALDPMAQERGIRLSRVLSNRAVTCDRDRLIQVLTNLVGNAIKFSPDGSVVEVRAGPTGDDRVRFMVIDQGPGIAPADLPKLFRRFQQLDASDSRQRGGTGLGLAISRAIVEQHGGEIGVESTPGTGSRFWFEIPGAGEAPSRESVELLRLDARHIVLLVEDDAEVARALRLCLTRAGYHTVRLGNPQRMDDFVRHFRPSLIIVDMASSGGEGTELLERFTQSPDMRDLPVLLLVDREPGQSAAVAPTLATALASSPTMYYLVRPIDETGLLRMVRRSMRRPGAARALLADDDSSTRRVLSMQLRALGVSCHEASSGEEVLRMVAQESPDLIVLDVNLPEMDGFAVVDVLRRGKSCVTPLIVYTGRDLGRREREALKLGTTRYLTKARVSETELLATVRELLDGVLVDDLRGTG